MTDGPYRQHKPEAPPPPPDSVEFPWSVRPDLTAWRIAVRCATVIAFVAGLAAGLHPVVALVAAAPLGLLGGLRRWDVDTVKVVCLRVESATLNVELDAAKVLRLPLSSVRDVQLERRVRGAAEPVVSTEGLTVTDVMRVTILRESGERLALTESYGSFSEGTHALSKARVFLRKHGWLPHDERAAEL